MTRWFVTFPQVYRFEDHPKLAGAHPEGYVEVEAKDAEKARKHTLAALGSHWSVMYGEDEFDAGYFPRGCLGRVRKVDGSVQIADVGMPVVVGG